MFSLTRALKLSYLFALGAVVLLFSKPQPAPAQRVLIAPLVMQGQMRSMQSMMQARMMLMMAGMSGGMMGMMGGMMGMRGGMMMGMGGMSMMGGMMGMRGMGMMGGMGFAGKGMGGFNGRKAL